MIKAVIFDMFETLITHYESPLYFAKQICADIGIPEPVFREIWDTTDEARTLGHTTLEHVIEDILRTNHRYSRELFDLIIQKRRHAKQQCFEHLHREILPMIHAIMESDIKLGLITNCYYEEADVIRQSILFPYFDAVCMSCELGLKKPDPAIFRHCTGELSVWPGECLYVGDGGSVELETAREIGMHPLQAVWYFKDAVHQPSGWRSEFPQAKTPMEVLSKIKKQNGSE